MQNGFLAFMIDTCTCAHFLKFRHFLYIVFNS